MTTKVVRLEKLEHLSSEANFDPISVKNPKILYKL